MFVVLRPSPPCDVRSYKDNQSSDESITAQTVEQTVMAEQVSHNVVNNSESASASAPADVAAHQTNNDIAGNGTTTDAPSHQSEPLPDTPFQHAKTENELATNANGHAADEPAESAAEPSAGEAAGLAAEAPVVAEVPAAEEKLGTENGELVNGTDDAISQGEGPPDDRSTADLSVNSENDVGRAEELEKKDGGHHVRSDSVKKPTTFSKVSVTKNFLAKSTTPTPAATKIGEKPSPVVAAAVPAAMAKPRLVAKTTALQNMLKPRMGTEGVSGPDASKVWNKNRRRSL